MISRVHPTRLISHTFRKHSPFGPEAFSNRCNIPEMFDDHEKHGGRIAEASEFSNNFISLCQRIRSNASGVKVHRHSDYVRLDFCSLADKLAQ
jgi:ligand-binding sensor protein